MLICAQAPAIFRARLSSAWKRPYTPLSIRPSSFRVRRACPPRAALTQEKHEKDWRITQMIDACKSYYGKLWSKADTQVADALLDDQVCRFQPATSAPPRLSPQCVHKDMIWGGKDLTVGPAAMATLVTETRKAYPDLVFEITQVGVIDVNNICVLWEGQATNLGEYHSHRPSFHNSTLSGTTIFRFNHDRSKIVEIVVYRMPFSEDRQELGAEGEEDMHTLHLARLHYEGKKKAASGSH